MRTSFLIILAALLMAAMTSCTNEKPDGASVVSEDVSKDLVRHWITGIWDNGDKDLFRELATDDYVYSFPGEAGLRGNAFLAYADSVRAAIPDLKNTIEEQIGEGDMVITRGTTRGTSLGAFGDIPPSGNSIEVSWVMFTRLEDGRITEEWEIFDTFAFMTQLGAVSTPE